MDGSSSGLTLYGEMEDALIGSGEASSRIKNVRLGFDRGRGCSLDIETVDIQNFDCLFEQSDENFDVGNMQLFCSIQNIQTIILEEYLDPKGLR